jgi:hypothetical protein
MPWRRWRDVQEQVKAQLDWVTTTGRPAQALRSSAAVSLLF